MPATPQVIVTTPEELKSLVRDVVREELGGKKPQQPETRVDVAAVMERWGVSRGTVHNWAKQGCPHDRRGKVVRFDLEAVAAWLKGRKLRAITPSK